MTAHHCHTCDQFIEDVSDRCAAAGARLTPIREQVLRLIVDQGKPVKAYDLLDQLKQSKSGSAPPTVYRALDFLLDNGFIHKLQSINAFISCGHLDEAHQGQFLICDQCELTVELDDTKLRKEISGAANAKGFDASHQMLEIHGTCQACQTDRPTNQT